MINNIDFLPERYKQRAVDRRAQSGRLLACVLFFAGLAATSAYQYWIYRGVAAELAQLEPAFAEAQVRRDQLAEIGQQNAELRRYADLYAYLGHPWPRSQVLALIAEAPPEISLVELELQTATVRPAEQAGGFRRRRDSAAEAAEAERPAPERDMKQLRAAQDQQRILLRVEGVTTDASALHEYTSALRRSPLCDDARLQSLETLGGESVAGGKQFVLEVSLAPGLGQPGAPDVTTAEADDPHPPEYWSLSAVLPLDASAQEGAP